MTIITRKDNIVKDYHAVKVADPYRSLEDANSTEVKIWTDEQNKQTHQHLIDFPQSETIMENITNLMIYTKYSLPQKKGGYYYFHKNNGLQNQADFYHSISLELENPEIIIDSNKN